MTEIYQWILEQLQHNQVFGGVVGASAFMTAGYYLRHVPVTLWNVFLRRCTVETIILSDTDVFWWLSEWLSVQPYMDRCLRTRVTAYSDDDEVEGVRRTQITLGDGHHVLFFHGRPVFIQRYLDDQRSGMNPVEGFQVRTLGTSQATVRAIIEEARQGVAGTSVLKIYSWDRWWRLAATRALRPLDTVIMKPEIRERILRDLTWFYDAERWYEQRGVSYRRGYLLAGEPGTGKTSVIVALASHLRRPLYVLNVGSLKNDNDLLEAFARCGINGIMVLEDIDAATRTRVASAAAGGEDDDDDTPITLSNLLNQLDGAMSPQGLVVFMTTNFPENLDPALMRPGRVDVRIDLQPFGHTEAEAMFRCFYPESDARLVLPNDSVTPAALQQVFMDHPHDGAAASRAVGRMK
ncbi:MAG: AAA family ATPase [Deltaproteobacteria bacterium]|nr:AAA family ATPase [Deltaproteobacteria bacterium]